MQLDTSLRKMICGLFFSVQCVLLHQRSLLELTRSGAYSDKMNAHIDSPEGRIRYGRCFATVEPVFGNLWHNSEKLEHHGYAQ